MEIAEARTIDQLLRAGAAALDGVSPTPRLDAEVLIGWMLGYSRLQLVMQAHDQVTPEQIERYSVLIARRGERYPVAYLTGEREFYGLSLRVTPAVLIPRPETEILVEAALEYARSRTGLIRLLDLGTGSGAIPIAIADTLRREEREFSMLAVDLSTQALSIAQENVNRHELGGKIELRHSNWFSAIAEDQPFDIIVSNPPYIARDDKEVSPELEAEPQGALYADQQGLADIHAIFSSLARRSVQPDLILVEIGSRQGEALVSALRNGELGDCYRNALVTVLTDLAGLPRVVQVCRSSTAPR